VVTGSLGGSAAGLRLASQRSWSDIERDALKRYMRPTPRVGEAGVLSGHGVTSMMDISDGLALDLSRLCEASDIGARVEIARVPAHPAATPAEALGGGEDYELLATLPDVEAVEEARSELREAFGVSLSDIGAIIEEGLLAVTDDGTEGPLIAEGTVAGWDHFR
jgi:thiamine-monophosphate kinase